MRTSEYQDVLFQPLPSSTPLSAGQEHAGWVMAQEDSAGLCYLQGRKGSLTKGVCSCHLSSWLQLSLNRTKQGATGKEIFREGAIS